MGVWGVGVWTCGEEETTRGHPGVEARGTALAVMLGRLHAAILGFSHGAGGRPVRCWFRSDRCNTSAYDSMACGTYSETDGTPQPNEKTKGEEGVPVSGCEGKGGGSFSFAFRRPDRW